MEAKDHYKKAQMVKMERYTNHGEHRPNGYNYNTLPVPKSQEHIRTSGIKLLRNKGTQNHGDIVSPRNDRKATHMTLNDTAD